MHKLFLTFGMFEMENAAEELLERAISKNDWNVHISYETIKDKVGFLCLISHGWLSYFPHFKSAFRPTKAFVERVVTKLQEPGRDADFRDKVLALKPLDDYLF